MPAAAHATLEAWLALDEDDSRELVDGVLEEAEVPTPIHETVVRWLVVWLDAYFRPRGGFVFASGIKLAIRRNRGRIADVVCYAAGRTPEIDGLVRTPPDIVIEVISRTPRDAARDRIQKPADYASFGVKQYWLVDPHARSFEVWQLAARRRHVRLAAATGGKIQRLPGYAGLTIDVDALWAEVDRLCRR
ncbi:MAG TPA: Uma2 family endonuclease [Polyangiaceae bacterium]|nr:Uma2 family endonuclease [Polyangiaceae bacterium]